MRICIDLTPNEMKERKTIGTKYKLPDRWFLCVSSDHHRKNLQLLFEAWCSVAHSINEDLVFVGKSLYTGLLKKIIIDAKNRGFEGRIRWLNSIDDKTLPSFYRGATATIAPSLYEGFGMTLLESMACGTPVIAARTDAYQEVGGNAVIFFDPTSINDLAGLIKRLSDNENFRSEFIKQGLQRVKEWSWKQTARQTLKVYKKVLSNKLYNK